MEALSKLVPGPVFLSLCVNFSAGSDTAITQICIFVLKQKPLERKKVLCKCYQNNDEVAAWLTRHFKAKNEGLKVITIEVNKANHISNYRTSHFIK